MLTNAYIIELDDLPRHLQDRLIEWPLFSRDAYIHPPLESMEIPTIKEIKSWMKEDNFKGSIEEFIDTNPELELDYWFAKQKISKKAELILIRVY